jgi:hypothetical protein
MKKNKPNRKPFTLVQPTLAQLTAVTGAEDAPVDSFISHEGYPYCKNHIPKA